MQFWKFKTCPKTWKIGMHFSFNISVTMHFQKFCRPAPRMGGAVLVPGQYNANSLRTPSKTKPILQSSHFSIVAVVCFGVSYWFQDILSNSSQLDWMIF